MRLSLQGDELSIRTMGSLDVSPPIRGMIRGIRRLLAHAVLTEARLDAAITQTEELLKPMLVARAGSEGLELARQELADLFQLLDTEASGFVPVANVEQLFKRLADHAADSPLSWRQAVPAPQAALALLILRECMHHGGFGAVRLASVPS